MTIEQVEPIDDIATIREELFAVQASNIALAAIIACMPEAANLKKEDVVNTCQMMCEMDAHTEMATSEFASSILHVAKEIKKMDEE